MEGEGSPLLLQLLLQLLLLLLLLLLQLCGARFASVAATHAVQCNMQQPHLTFIRAAAAAAA